MRTSALWFLAAPFTASAVLLVFACGGSASSSSPGASDAAGTDAGVDGAADPVAACAAYATARCEKFDGCTANLYSREHFDSAATCAERGALGCMTALAAADTAATPSFFASCAEAIAAASCADFVDGTTTPQACAALAGARANGRGCAFNAQCQSTWCSTSRGDACGTCELRPAAGAACSADADCGGRGMLCAKAGMCAVPVATAGACDDARPCGVGLTCVGKIGTNPGACQPEATTAGAACDLKKAKGAGCQAELGLHCGPDDHCVADALVAPPAACGRLVDADSGAADGGDAGPGTFTVARCLGGAACAPTGMCIAPAADGAACDRVNGPSCLAPARCVSATDASTAGTCLLPGAAACP